MSHVLVVEDDVLLGAHMAELLRAAGYSVTHAPHAIDAITAIDETPPDVIVLDVLLVATTGIALLHELQSYDDTAQIPIIICTSLADSLPAGDLAAYGVRHIIDKATMLPQDLIAAVRRVVAA